MGELGQQLKLIIDKATSNQDALADVQAWYPAYMQADDEAGQAALDNVNLAGLCTTPLSE